MNWETTYLEHPLWAAASTALADLASGVEALPDHDRTCSDRIRFVLNYLSDQADPAQPLVSRASLDAAQQAVASLGAQVNQWVATQNASYLEDAASTRVDALLDALRGWPLSKDRYAKGVMAAAEDFVGQSHSELQALREGVGEVQTELADMRKTLEDDRKASELAVEDFKAKVQAAKDATERQTTRLDEALNGLQATFAAAEAQRAETHRAALEAQAKAEAEAREAAGKTLKDDREQWAADADAALAQIKDLKSQADELVGAVGLAVTSTEYSKYAEQERKAANFWRGIAASSFGLAFVVFLLMLLAGLGGQITGDTPWQLVVFKVTGSAGLLALGYYAGRESKSHREAERTAKSIQLDLAALEPFIANMPEDQKERIRLGAAQRLFVNTQLPRSAAEPAEHPSEPSGGDSVAVTLRGTLPQER